MNGAGLLGIYIPTYNRKRELEECLRNLIPQLRPYNFPIYISDNGSTDGTGEMVKRIKKGYGRIYYRRNAENISYPRNLLNVLRMGRTAYAWELADDDALYPGTIDIIVKELNQGYAFLQINSDMYSQDMKRKIKSRILPYAEDVVYEGGEHEKALLAHRHTGYQGFNPHMVIRKSLVDREARRIDPNAPNLDFLHTILFYRGIVGQRGKLIALPLIKNRGGNWSYSKRVMEIYFKSWYTAHDMLSAHYSKKTLEEAEATGLVSLFIPIVIDRIMNDSKPGFIYETYIKRNSNIKHSYKWMLRLVVFAPRYILRAAYKTYRGIKRY